METFKNIKTGLSKLFKKKVKPASEVELLRKELEVFRIRLEKSEKLTESLAKRIENLEKAGSGSETVATLSEEPLIEEPQGDVEETDLPVACNATHGWKFWKRDSRPKTLVYQNCSSSSGEFRNKSTGVEGKFSCFSYTSATMSEYGGMDDASQSSSVYDRIHSEMVRKAIEMA